MRDQAKKLQARLATLRAGGFDNVGDLLDSGVPGKWHALRANRSNQVACSLVEPWRLIFEPSDPSTAMTDDGTIDCLRYKRDDHFWFSFFHEAGHILLHRKHGRLVDQVGDETTTIEREANDFAAQMLIPLMHEHRLANLQTEQDIRLFAQQIGIAPGIAVGRLQRDRGQFNRWNSLRHPINFI